MDNSELLHMLEVPESLKSKLEEAVSVLQEHQSLGTVPMVLNDLLRTLTSAPPRQQKQIIGDHLYRQIYNLHNDLAGKITGKWDGHVRIVPSTNVTGCSCTVMKVFTRCLRGVW